MIRIVLSFFVAASAFAKDVPSTSCEANLIEQRSERDLPGLRPQLEALAQMLPKALGSEVEATYWYKLLIEYILPSLDRTDLVVNTLVGLGASRKTTIANATEHLFSGIPDIGLARPFAKPDPDSGTTRQMVVQMGSPDGVKPERRNSWPALNELFRRFPGLYDRDWTQGADERAGHGVIAYSQHLPHNFAMVDSNGMGVVDDDDDVAFRTIRSSDVLILTTIGISAQKDVAYTKRIRELFAKHGPRKIIMIVSDITEKGMPKARARLVEFSNSIFGTSGEDFPTGVLGAYVMPYDPQVADGEKHPEFIPMLRKGALPFLPLGRLYRGIAAVGRAAGSFGVNAAIDLVLFEAGKALHEKVTSHLSAQLYLAALPKMKDDAIAAAGFSFPGENYVRYVFNNQGRYNDVLGPLELGYDRIVDVVDLGWTIVKPGRKHARAQQLDRSSDWKYQGKFADSIDAWLAPFVSHSALPNNFSLLLEKDSDLAKRFDKFSVATGVELTDHTRIWVAKERAKDKDKAQRKLLLKQLDGQTAEKLPDLNQLPGPVKLAIDRMIGREKSSKNHIEAIGREAVGEALNPDFDKADVFQPRSTLERRVARTYKAVQAGLTGTMVFNPFGAAVDGIGRFSVKEGARFGARFTIGMGSAALSTSLGGVFTDKQLAWRTSTRVSIYVQERMGEAMGKELLQDYESVLIESAPVPDEAMAVQSIIQELNPYYEALPRTLD